MQDLRLIKPIELILLGPSQHGKSTWIKKMFGADLKSGGKDIEGYGLGSTTTEVTVYKRINPESGLMFMIDTPGLNDQKQDDLKMSKFVIEKLKEKCSPIREKMIMFFCKFTSVSPGTERRIFNLIKKIVDEFPKSKIEMMVVFTYANITNENSYPGNWLRTTEEGNSKIAELSNYTEDDKENYQSYLTLLFEKWKEDRKASFYGLREEEKLENLKCHFVCSESGRRQPTFLPIQDSEIVQYISTVNPALILHMAASENNTIKLKALSIIGGLSLTALAVGLVGFTALGPASVGLSLLYFCLGNMVDSLKVIIIHDNYVLWSSLDNEERLQDSNLNNAIFYFSKGHSHFIITKNESSNQYLSVSEEKFHYSSLKTEFGICAVNNASALFTQIQDITYYLKLIKVGQQPIQWSITTKIAEASLIQLALYE